MARTDVSFNVTPEQDRLISKIVKRAVDAGMVAPDGKKRADHVKHHHMNLCAVIANNPDLKFNLEKLRDSSDFDFAHDMVGIDQELDRSTGKIETFLPRCCR